VAFDVQYKTSDVSYPTKTEFKQYQFDLDEFERKSRIAKSRLISLHTRPCSSQSSETSPVPRFESTEGKGGFPVSFIGVLIFLEQERACPYQHSVRSMIVVNLGTAETLCHALACVFSSRIAELIIGCSIGVAQPFKRGKEIMQGQHS
jgi:hypothetical protein